MKMYIINILIYIVYGADQEKMHEFVKPLSCNKCTMIRMYLNFFAINKVTTDKTLKVGKELTRVVRDCLWKTTIPRNTNRAD